MHSDPLDDLFANIAPDSPLAEEMEALLTDGLAVDPDTLDTATDAVLAQVQPRPRAPYLGWAAAGLIAAAAVGLLTVNFEAPTRDAHPGHDPAPASPSVAVEVPPASAARVTAVTEALSAGKVDLSLLLFNQLLERGQLSEQQLRHLTIQMHQAANEADPEQQALMLEQTVSGYEAWIAAHSDSPHAASMNYAFAELLYKTQRYDEAFDHYMTVATTYPDSKHASFCAESAVFAAENVIRLRQADGSWDGSPEAGLNRSETQLIAAIDAAVDRDPTSDKARQLQYKGAYALYTSGEHADARERFEAVIDMDPGSPTAVQAANLIADSFAKSEDWESLEATALRFYEDDALGDEDFEASMYSIANRAAMKQLLDGGLSVEEAADAWLALLDQYGDLNGTRDLTIEALRAAGRDPEADRLAD